MKNKLYKNLNVRVKNILLLSEGWLVGNSITNIINDDKVNDYDIVVPDRALYHNILFLAHTNNFSYHVNSYGGMKLVSDTLTIDIWCEELSHFMLTAKELKFIYNYKRNILLKII